MGQPAIGLTDHGTVNGLFDFWRTCRRTGIRPILGLETYVTPETDQRDMSPVSWDPTSCRRRNPDDGGGGGRFTHLSLWAETDAGLANMLSIVVRHEPRGQGRTVSASGSGAAVTVCLGPDLWLRLPVGCDLDEIAAGTHDDALRMAGDLQDIFGRGNFGICGLDP